jgi:hypothetical protein
LALALVLSASGCKRLLGYTDAGGAPIRHYPDGATGLQEFWSDVLDAAKKDERDRVHDLLATTLLSDEELSALLGAKAGELAPRYHALMATFINRGAVELVAQVYERKLDTVEVVAIDPAAKDATPEDRAIAAALTGKVPWYSVRVRRAADTKGLRYDFFFYWNGRWATGNQIGKYIK